MGDINLKKILILTDYDDNFLISIKKNKYVSMDVEKIKNFMEKKGYDVTVLQFSDIDFKKNYKDYYVLYQSSELIGQFYKKYIEDIIYFLQLSGAHVLPDYKYLKAHHNKGFMELIRSSFKDESLKTISSNYFGTSKEALKKIPKLPVVIKQISGSGSRGVYLAKTRTEYRKFVKKASRTIIGNGYINYHLTFVKNVVKNLLALISSKYEKNNIEKIDRPIIVQKFIPNLAGDYKVLYFGGKYYTLFRKNRKNDFRASGSGDFSEVKMEENYPLLDFAEKVVKEIDFPILGLDIAFDGTRFHLIEFQMLHIGPYTLQNSNYYFIKKNNRWIRIDKKSDLEIEFARSICDFIKLKEKNK